MHSVRRVKTSAEQRERRRLKEAGEIVKYRKLNDAVLERRTNPQAFMRTSSLLAQNPEHYTVWNIRRERLEALFSENKTDPVELLKGDLKFTESLLPSHPKVYWIWNHRRWVLSKLTKFESSEFVWGRELALTTKLLERDPRNFHGWSYRHWVVTHSGVSNPDAEFAFTTAKINENFSNFSAWHRRSLIISQLDTRPALQKELDYVYGAVAMDPQDQSGWLYYQWLLESPTFRSEITLDVLNEQQQLVRELWEEEHSVWAARMLCDLAKLLGQAVNSSIVLEMKKLDPLRKGRYEDILKSQINL